ncbi:23S rRNA (adenine(2030)-N(6))-methyltransferase RlmJ [Basilea psittacipulmonis]|uniref:Ribosomal RNA large subunit methyltransferase J n=1 Tax=Basilea psittacipulmonis DSM 24701 TaxID=1072685 RepID=A0A077DEK8_9BURK|nr:23S rRNA (adenine(2030)-N(6))-methyltransferase RlmJ [Basilea psittacipulmonis]AIL32601.1 competence protein ComJ [Basilea psittacipulmonis DSM 24701]
MFSYRHGFHAGNHADVLKHAVFLDIIRYFQQKDNPFWIIDTHAGAGVYDLTSQWAQQSGEFYDGVERLKERPHCPELIDHYLTFIHDTMEDNVYPGSPWIAMSMSRDRDKLRFFEWHPNEFQNLNAFVQSQDRALQRNIMTFHADGFVGIKALLPPPTKRAITIIDPSYENKRDYQSVITCLQEALKRFATGCYIVWYPLVKRVERQEMLKQLEKMKVSWLHVSLQVKSPEAVGLYGSGLFIVNPPYQLEQKLKEAMPVLCEMLAQDENAHFVIKTSA